MEIKKTSLYELGEEYDNHVKTQKYFISRCKKDIERAKKSGDTNAVVELERKLKIFYLIKYELEQTAIQLKNYYRS